MPVLTCFIGRHQSIPPTTSFSLIAELIHRDGLRSALGGRDDVLLEPVLNLLVRHVSDPRFGEMACDVATVVIGMCFHLVAKISRRQFVLRRYVRISTGSIPIDRRPLWPTAQKGVCGT